MAVRTREAWVAALLGVALFLFCCSLTRGGLFDSHPYGDVHLYGTYSHRMTSGEVPYRDFFDEYPPFAQAAFLAPRALGTGYAATFKWCMAACGAAALALLVATLASAGASRARVWAAAGVAGVAPLAVGPIFLNAYDLWPALLVGAALLLLIRRRDTLAFAFLGAAVAAKIYPLAALPVAALAVWGDGGREALRRPLAAFAGVLTLTHLPFLVLGPGGLRFSYWVQLKRGLQLESLGGSLLLAADKLGLYTATLHDQAPGSKNVIGPFAQGVATLTSVVQAAAVLLVAWVFVRRGGALLTAIVASVVAFVAFGKVFSPQFVDWLVPLVPAAGVAASAVLLGVLVLTRALFDHYLDVYAGGDAVWILVARNLVVVGLLALLVRRMRTT
jgi:hypothetical protein